MRQQQMALRPTSRPPERGGSLRTETCWLAGTSNWSTPGEIDGGHPPGGDVGASQLSSTSESGTEFVRAGY